MECKNADDIIFLGYFKNFDCEYSKIFLRIRFFGSGRERLAEIFTNTLCEKWPTRFLNFHTVLEWHRNICDKNFKKISLICWYQKNISKSNFENLVDQFLDSLLVKICVNFQPNPKKSNAQEIFVTFMCFFLFNIWISQEIIHTLFSSYSTPHT